MNINELKKRIADAGCVGAGGAGFPTAVKVAEGADSLIINAAECEPLLYTDYYVMKRAMERIASGAETVMEAAGIPNGYLGVKAHTAKRLGLSHGDAVSSHVKVHILPDVYPMGDEIILIYQVLGRVVTPGSLPRRVRRAPGDRGACWPRDRRGYVGRCPTWRGSRRRPVRRLRCDWAGGGHRDHPHGGVGSREGSRALRPGLSEP